MRIPTANTVNPKRSNSRPHTNAVSPTTPIANEYKSGTYLGSNIPAWSTK